MSTTEPQLTASGESVPTLAECEQYFRERGVRAEQGAKFWQTQQQYKWRTRYPIWEQADRWIANAKPHERLRPDEFAPTHRLKPFPVPPREPSDPNLIPMPEHMRRHRGGN